MGAMPLLPGQPGHRDPKRLAVKVGSAGKEGTRVAKQNDVISLACKEIQDGHKHHPEIVCETLDI